MVVAAVLKTGGDYDVRWVRALEQSLYRFLLQPHRFVCLTDLVDQRAFGPFVELIPLVHDLPGWWSKIELFRPDVFNKGEPVLYIDLDSVICRNLEKMQGVIDCDLILLRDFYRTDKWATGLMGFEAGRFPDIYLEFMLRAEFWMRKYRSGGDQRFLNENFPDLNVRFWQDELPGEIVSYKVHCRDGLPSTARVVCFHGKPRPSEIKARWLPQKWSL